MTGLVDGDRRRRRNLPDLIGRCIISCIFTILSQLSLLLIPHFFPSFPLFSQLLLSAAVLVLILWLGQSLRRLTGLRASAPTFVFFHVIFIWLVYLSVIRQAVSMLIDMIFNGELAILLIGFFRILMSDPGYIRHDSSNCMEGSVSEVGAHSKELPLSARGICLQSSNEVTSLPSRRVRYCRSCEAYVRGFDHHCPAFGNCIGQNNYVLFMALLIGFLTTEASYIICCCQWVERYQILNGNSAKIYLYESLAVSTMYFSSLQMLWQVVFLGWHCYCVCFNIRTDEWINWRRYPEFHIVVHSQPGQSSPEMGFRNPYDKGILCNLKDLLTQE